MDDYEEPHRRRYIVCPDTMCGADDCPTCFPWNFVGGIYKGDIEDDETENKTS